MASKKNTNFRLGLTRKELIEAAQLFGKSEKTAKKDSTKRLEEYITRRVSGERGMKVPELSERAKRDVKDWNNKFGIHDAVHSVSYHIAKITGKQDMTNYLRLTIGRNFKAYVDGAVTNEMIDELVKRIGDGTKNEIISGVESGDYYYEMIFNDYADEIEADKEAERQEQEERNNQNIQKGDQEFEMQTNSKSNKNKNKRKR